MAHLTDDQAPGRTAVARPRRDWTLPHDNTAARESYLSYRVVNDQ